MNRKQVIWYINFYPEKYINDFIIRKLYITLSFHFTVILDSCLPFSEYIAVIVMFKVRFELWITINDTNIIYISRQLNNYEQAYFQY